jgi:hypothetical protein
MLDAPSNVNSPLEPVAAPAVHKPKPVIAAPAPKPKSVTVPVVHKPKPVIAAPAPAPEPLTSDPLLQCLAELHEPTYVKLAKMRTQQRDTDNVTKLEFIPLLRNPELKSRLWARDTRYASLIETESDLTSSTPIRLMTFLTLCRLFEVSPFLVIYKDTYYVFGHDPTDSTAPLPTRGIVYITAARHPFWKWNAKISHIPPYRIEKITKPYRAVSSYKIAELRDLCAQLGLSSTENATNVLADTAARKEAKPELYAQLKSYFALLIPPLPASA